MGSPLLSLTDSGRLGGAVPDPVDEDANGVSRSSRLELVIAEYQTVAGLIQYFRDVEMKALAGAGLVLSVAGAGYATLAAGSKTNKDAQAILLVASAWVSAVLLLVA
jgi:putative copper export protein